MVTKDQAARRGWRAAAEHLQVLGRELREARLNADLSQRRVAVAVGVSPAEVGRIERAQAPSVPLARLDAFAAVVGTRLSVKLYPAGLPLRDAAQVALLERFRACVHSSLTWRVEVPLSIPGDLRAWDASVGSRDWCAFIDAETRVRDAQALQRRTALKARDTGTNRVILLLTNSRANRLVVASLGSPLVDGALNSERVLAALRAGRDPGGSAVILL